MEILKFSSNELFKKQLNSGTVRSIKCKNKLNSNELIKSEKSCVGLTSSNVIQTKMLWNTSGWIRVYCGPDRFEISCDDPSRMIHVASTATTNDVIRDMDLPSEYTIWVQLGGAITRRLNGNEYPFIVQEEFLKTLGYVDESRRSRLGIDPELKFLIRFHIGPAEISTCRGVTKSGSVEILKGLVFPQWRRRSIAVVGSKLLVFPGNYSSIPEMFELTGAEIFEHSPNYNRLILKVIPKTTNESPNHLKDDEFMNNNNNNVYNSNCSVYSSGDREKVLFLGFEESWERDLWSTWLLEATSEIPNSKRMDICGSGLQAIPEIVLQSTNIVEELLAGQNKLQEIALNALTDFPNLKILRLPGNGFKSFPNALLDIYGLTVLDLANNEIDEIPDDISKLQNLEELRFDSNELTEIPENLKYLTNLNSLQLSKNHIKKLPGFMIDMRNVGLVDMFSQKSDLGKILNINNENNNQKNDLNPPLTKVNLRSNQLKGSIILGNYGFLTQLDVSENSIEILDLSALDKLETLQCSRNKLSELTVNGRILTSLIAGNNNLTKLTVTPVPTALRHLDVSFNNLIELPDWLSGCHQLRTLFATNNKLQYLPDHLFCSENGSLHTLQLGYNHLRQIPSMPRRKLPLQELFLQSNLLDDLPEHFFYACENLILLNISSNNLLALPKIEGRNSQIEKFYSTNNRLTDKVLDSLMWLTHLRTLHIGYNRLTTLPENCVSNWLDLEELILSGNKLQHLPDNLANLGQLRVLRVHSNKLQSAPPLSRTITLRVLDLAHNQLDRINLVTLVPKKLQFLDLSCNKELQVDPKQLQVCRSQRPMSLVDVSGKNRVSLPSSPDLYQENSDFEPPWTVGFSETAGSSPKLYVSQLRLPGFCNSEALFGMFDGEINSIVPNLLVKAIPKILLEERTVKETASDYMKYTLLSAHRELKQQGQKHGVCATLCHISRTKASTDIYNHGGSSKRFILRVSSVGEATAYLVRRAGYVKLTPSTPKRQIGNSASFPLIIPDPEVSEVTLGDQDEYLIMANKKLWEVIDIEAVVTEIKKEKSIILSAKRIQDISQSYGAEDNLSIIIVKLNNLGTDVDFLMKELRHTIRKKPSSIISGFCKCGCCCESNNSCCHSGAGFLRQSSARSDRSSPSGQSDQTANEIQTISFLKQKHGDSIGSRRSSNYTTNDRRSLRGGVVRAVRAKIEEEREREKEESDSAMSEEQYKCWEYMLEQNTQLLFDKELNTISKAFTKKLPQSNLTRSQLKALTSSTPQLSYNEHNPRPVVAQMHPKSNVPFLSKHFGSARSFHPQAPSLFKPMRFSSGRVQQITGGPNAAYFGSLQRLMPYNLEYDFAVMNEKVTEESLNQEQYWGVATTEL